MNSFEGQMQQLIINGKSYFELIDNGDLINSVNRTAAFVRSDLPHKYPLTFHNKESWISLPKIDSHQMFLIQFHFKTSEENGLILYNNGQSNDNYLAIELVDGQIYFMFSFGKTTINTIKSKTKRKLNDNKWHLVSVWRSTKTNYELSVDSLVYKFSSNNNEHGVFNLHDRLFVGGLRDSSKYDELKSKSKIISSYGYKGCLASFEINGKTPDFDDVLNIKGRMHGNITKGCESKFSCFFPYINKRINVNLI